MTHMAFGIHDAFEDPDNVVLYVQPAMLSAANPPRNVVTDRPKQVWMNEVGGWAPSGISDDSYYNYFDITEGGGSEVSATLGNIYHQRTADEFAHLVEGRLNSVAGLSLSYTCTYNSATGKFTISASGDFAILWKTGTHGQDNGSGRNFAQWLGFKSSSGISDSTGSNTYTAPESRYDTELAMKLARHDASSKTTAHVFAAVLHSAASSHGDEVDFSDLKIYGSTKDLPPTRFRWEAEASTVLTFSPRSADPDEMEPTNKIQIAFEDGGAAMSATYWFVSWRYFDETKGHAMGLLKALEVVQSSTRQISQMRGHGLIDPSTPLGVDTYWPVHNQLRWIAPLSFDAWGGSDYRAVVQEAVKSGRCKGLLWALRWDKIVDGTHNARDEASRGFLLWAAIQDYSDDDYEGSGSNEFLSGELTIEQVR